MRWGFQTYLDAYMHQLIVYTAASSGLPASQEQKASLQSDPQDLLLSYLGSSLMSSATLPAPSLHSALAHGPSPFREHSSLRPLILVSLWWRVLPADIHMASSLIFYISYKSRASSLWHLWECLSLFSHLRAMF